MRFEFDIETLILPKYSPFYFANVIVNFPKKKL